jgi:hypothetical protein
VFIGTYMAELSSKPFAGDVAFGVASWALVVHIISVPAFGLIADKHGTPSSFCLRERGDLRERKRVSSQKRQAGEDLRERENPLQTRRAGLLF